MLMRIQLSENCSTMPSLGIEHWAGCEFPDCQIHSPRLECGQKLGGKILNASKKKKKTPKNLLPILISFSCKISLSLDAYFSMLLCFLPKVKEEMTAIFFSSSPTSLFPHFRKTAPSRSNDEPCALC